MAAPELSHVAQQLYDSLAPLAYDDEAHGWALAHYCAALASMFDEAADLSRDGEDGAPGWSQLFDPDTVPVRYLRWLGQLRGVRVDPALPEDAQRHEVRSVGGTRRGTPDAIRAAVRAHLTGSKTVYLSERAGSAWQLRVATLTSETPSPSLVDALLKGPRVVPGGIVVTYETVDGGDFDTLRDTHSDFADVTATFATFDELRDNPAQQ